MPPQLTDRLHQATLLAKKKLDERTMEFVFYLGESTFSFQAGQYIWLVLPQLASHLEGDRRAFSIISRSNQPSRISVIARTGSSTYKQTLWNVVPDSRVQIVGPFGQNYIVKDTTAANLVMVAGGVGIAPFLSVLRTGDPRLQNKKVHLMYLSRPTEIPVFVDELKEMTQQHPWFTLQVENRHFVADMLPPVDISSTHYWVCGPLGMVDAVHAELHSRGIPEDRCFFEQFHPSISGELQPEIVTSAITWRDPSSPLKDNAFFLAVESSTNHIILTDANGRVVYANPAAERITGYTFAEMKGQTPRLWGGLMAPDFYTSFWHIKAMGVPFDGQVTNRRKNGQLYQAIAHIGPIFDHENKLIGFIASEEDISPLKEAEEKIKQHNTELEAAKQELQQLVSDLELEKEKTQVVTQRLQLATSAAQIGVWEWDIEKNTLLWDDTMLALYQQTAASFTPTMDSWESVIHPDDVNRVREELNESLASKDTTNSVFQVVLPDSSIRFLKTYALVIRNEQRQASRLLGVQWDITKEKEVDRMKSEFISMASHQLRTPLSTIRWYGELLSGSVKNSTDSDTMEYVETINSATHRMIDLVNGLLNISRIEMGTFSINPVESRIQDIFAAVMVDVQALIEKKHAQIHQYVDTNLSALPLDANLVHIILMNLLTNAIKYSHDAGEIDMHIRSVGQGETVSNKTIEVPSILIQITDHGIGVPEKQQAQLFGKLFRADNARRYENDGNGLGLYLVKSIIDESGGLIWFESVEGQGTTFFVTIPQTGMKARTGSKQLDPVL